MKKNSLTLQIIIALILGTLAGLVFKEKIAVIGEIAKWFISLIKVFAIPILFFAIIDSIISMQIKARGVWIMLAISLINAFAAIIISLFVANYFKAGTYLEIKNITVSEDTTSSSIRSLNWRESIATLIPDSILSPFVSNSVPGIIIIAIFLGLAVLAVDKTQSETHQHVIKATHNFIKLLLALLFQIIHWLIYLTPLVVFAACAKSVGTHGFEMFKGLSAYLLAGTLGMFLQVVFIYQFWIAKIGKIKLSYFWTQAKETLFYAFGVNSSLATLPLTLKTLDNLKVSPNSARLSACIGTNFNNDGILLYEVFAALFVAQAYGIHLDLSQQITLALIAILATLGVAGIPEAGFIVLSLVLTSLGLPLEILPLLLTVDWLLARLRSVTNVISDLTVGIAINALLKERESI